MVSPRVDRGDRNLEVFREIFNSEQPINGIHGSILQPYPLTRVSTEFQQSFNRVLADRSTRLRSTPRRV